ncbi:MAG: exodeoxyribonuclease VII large subunit, partial [Candidatus Krumholzibacteriota bacterium]|nr:exodeoxyribonuclease VII large subunit [Candidatus Krumholzibacteriota bacterium]
MELPFGETDVYSVSEINELVSGVVQEHFPRVSVVGEVSNFRRPSSGHLYFTLKDEQAQLRSVCFRQSANRLEVELADGISVIVTGRLTVYPAYGQYQLVADAVVAAGEGRLELAFQQLKSRLEREGLFDAEHKQELPRYPSCIAVVTSPTGAALHDILVTLSRRWPCVDVLVAPVRVQGDLASGEIVGALEMLSRSRGVDLIIAGRGGGSLEDLWAFNTEPVARAIFDCPIPVISAVGHETDVTIADLVADRRAATPTMAAELAVPVRAEVIAKLERVQMRLEKDANLRIELTRRHIREMLRSHAMGKIRGRIEQGLQKLDYLLDRLERAVRQG